MEGEVRKIEWLYINTWKCINLDRAEWASIPLSKQCRIKRNFSILFILLRCWTQAVSLLTNFSLYTDQNSSYSTGCASALGCPGAFSLRKSLYHSWRVPVCKGRCDARTWRTSIGSSGMYQWCNKTCRCQLSLHRSLKNQRPTFLHFNVHSHTNI